MCLEQAPGGPGARRQQHFGIKESREIFSSVTQDRRILLVAKEHNKFETHPQTQVCVISFALYPIIQNDSCFGR